MSRQKIFAYTPTKLTQQEASVYEAIAEEINGMREQRDITTVQALIELLIKKQIISHNNYFELYDETIGTKDVRLMYKERYGEKRVPTHKTVRTLAKKYALGVQVGGIFQHSKKRWTEFLQTRCIYKGRRIGRRE